jgi:hypothetical protein
MDTSQNKGKEIQYCGIITETVFAKFVKTIDTFQCKISQQLPNVLIVKEKKGASKCVTVATTLCALNVMIISKLKVK